MSSDEYGVTGRFGGQIYSLHLAYLYERYVRLPFSLLFQRVSERNLVSPNGGGSSSPFCPASSDIVSPSLFFSFSPLLPFFAIVFPFFLGFG